jgi:hypothetical protein
MLHLVRYFDVPMNPRLRLTWCLWVLTGWVWSAVATDGVSVEAPFPLKKGLTWSYEGKVEWTAPNSAKVLSTNVHWVMEVVDVLAGDGIQASVVHGLPDQLAWYEPGRVPGFAVLVSNTNCVYRVPATDEKDAKRLARRLVGRPIDPALSREAWLVFPLTRGMRWGEDDERTDNRYCWYVEGKRAKHLRIEGFPATAPAEVWTISYRTNPDHQRLELVEGLGITRYVYVHHGTVASVDVRLVSVRHRQ